MSNPSLHPKGWFDKGFKNKKMLSCDPTVEEPPTHILIDYLSATATPPPPRVQGHAGNRLLATRILTVNKHKKRCRHEFSHAYMYLTCALLASMYLLSCMTYTPHSQEGATTLKTLGIQEQNNHQPKTFHSQQTARKPDTLEGRPE